MSAGVEQTEARVEAEVAFAELFAWIIEQTEEGKIIWMDTGDSVVHSFVAVVEGRVLGSIEGVETLQLAETHLCVGVARIELLGESRRALAKAMDVGMALHLRAAKARLLAAVEVGDAIKKAKGQGQAKPLIAVRIPIPTWYSVGLTAGCAVAIVLLLGLLGVL